MKNCKTCNYVSSWLKEYMKHPIGSGATIEDYALSIALGLLLLFVLYKVIEEVR